MKAKQNHFSKVVYDMKQHCSEPKPSSLPTILLLLLVASTVFLLLAAVPRVSAQSTASVWTNQADYPPDSVVTISGSGFSDYTPIAITVLNPNNSTTILGATTDQTGSFSVAYRIDSFVGTYLVSATDNSGNTATTSFTDSAIESVTVGSQTGALTAGTPGSASYSITVTVGNGQGGANIYVCLMTSLPTGASGTFASSSGYATESAPFTTTFTISTTAATPAGVTSFTIYSSHSDPSCGNPDNEGGGTLTVGGPSSYSVTFDQRGIPGSVEWGVTVGGTDYTGTGSSIIVTGLSGTNSYSYDAPVSGASGVQYVCSSGCSGSFSGPPLAPWSASYTTQYYLAVSSLYGSPAGAGWYNAGVPASFSVTTPTGGSGTLYLFSAWTGTGTGSYGGSNNPGTVTMNDPITETASWTTQYQVTYQASGCVLAVTVPSSEWVTSGGSATGVFPSSVAGLGTQCAFVKDDRSTTITAPTTITGTYQTQYLLTVMSPYGSPSGAGWYNAGVPASFSVTTPTSGGPGIQYAFSAWAGIGSGSYSGSSNPGSVTMNSPMTEIASWTTQYSVTYTATGCPLTVTVPTEWVTSGGSAAGVFPSTVSGSGTRCLFVSDNRPSTITGPTTITGTYQTQYHLSVSSAYGSPVGAGWYNAGSAPSFGVTTPASGGSGTQYAFTSWAGTGAGSYSGSTNPGAVTMNNPITETASWATQYSVTYAATGCVLSVIPPASEWVTSGGSATGVFASTVSGSGTRCLFVSDNRPSTITGPTTITGTYQAQYYLTVSSPYSSPTGAGWYNVGAPASFSVPASASGGTGTRHLFSSWAGSGTGSYSGPTNPGTATMNGPITETASYTSEYQVTYQSTGCALTVTVPSSEWVISGGSATGVFASTVSGSGTQCLFLSDDRPGTITAPTAITGTYQTQYYLTVSSLYGSPTGAGWYNAGSPASFSVTTPSGGSGTQYLFSSWAGTGASSYSGSNNPGSVTMNGPVTEAASWATQYSVEYQVTGCALSVTLPPSEWVTSGGTSTGVFPTPISGSGTQCLFVSDDRPSTITNPTTITGTYQTQYYLTVSSSYGSPTGAGWYNVGAPASFSVTTPSSGGLGTQYVFTSWAGTGASSYSGSNNPGSVTMNGPVTEAASWATQYQVTYQDTGCVLTVTLPPSEWVTSGGSAVGVFTSTVSGSGTRCLFVSDNRPSAITAPSTITGTYQTQYQVTFAISPIGSGTTSPSGANQWEDSGTQSISASANTGYEFSFWAATGSITFASTTSDSTTATISGPGTITANFVAFTTTTVTCVPSTIAFGSVAWCGATVSGGPLPHGQVTFKASIVGKVTFLTPATCTLDYGFCSVDVRGLSPGSIYIIATYGGDPVHLGSTGSGALVVAETGQPPGDYRGFGACGSSVPPTGISVTLDSANVGAEIYTTNLGNLGSGTTGLLTIRYYEVQIVGVSDGYAWICLYGPQVNAQTQIEYYYGGWKVANPITITVGSSVGGRIPVAALTNQALVTFGTPIDPKGMVSSPLFYMSTSSRERNE